jgi:hypothetical protein
MAGLVLSWGISAPRQSAAGGRRLLPVLTPSFMLLKRCSHRKCYRKCYQIWPRRH